MKDIEAGDLDRSVENPWIRNAGIFADDPTWDDFLKNMADYRRQLDEEEASQVLRSICIHRPHNMEFSNDNQ